MSGQEKTIKTPKMFENIENCSTHIGKGSRSMFVSQCYMYPVCKSKQENSSKVLHTLNTLSLFSIDRS